MTIKLGLIGASGRMGAAVAAAVATRDDIELAAAIVHPQSSALGDSRYGLVLQSVTSPALHRQPAVDVLVDFSLPDALLDNLALALHWGCALVICATGLSPSQQRAIDDASQHIPILYAANTSVGVNLLQALVGIAAAALPAADIEITEAHHRMKRDAPSGTALVLGEAAAQARGDGLAEVNAGIRGDALRQTSSIGFSVIRAADIIGEHTVLLAQPGERIELTHRVSDRRIFAEGAVRAGEWLIGQAAGRYSMRDMLNLDAILQRI